MELASGSVGVVVATPNAVEMTSPARPVVAVLTDEQGEPLPRPHHLDLAQTAARLGSAREKLLAIRNQRVWPGRDEKILTSWNAMTIRGMAIAAIVLGWLELAALAVRIVAAG